MGWLYHRFLLAALVGLTCEEAPPEGGAAERGS